MEEKTLFKVALSCSLIGIIFLLILSDMVEAEPVNIKDVNANFLGKEIKVIGKAINIVQKEKVTFFDIKGNTGIIKATAFRNINVGEGNKIEILGKVEEYKGKMQLNVKIIKLIK